MQAPFGANFKTEIAESLPVAGFLSLAAQPETVSAKKSSQAGNLGQVGSGGPSVKWAEFSS